MKKISQFPGKHFLCLFFVFLLCLSTYTTVFANVGMIYSADREASEFFVDDSHPLTVESEQLTFDVHTRKASHAKALWSDVTAVYQVTNPTAEAVEVQAMFPVIVASRIEEPNTHDVRFEGQALDFDIRYANVPLSSIKDMEFETVLSHLRSGGYGDRNLVLIIFPLRVEPYQTGKLEISSVTSADSDHKLVTPFHIITKSEYTFQYFLSPAKHWADFKDLTITIHAPMAAPFLVDSSLNFHLSGINTYTAHYDTLPEGNLTFTLQRSMLYSAAILAGMILLWKLGKKVYRNWKARQ